MGVIDKLHALFDDALEDIFHRQPFNIEKARKSVLKLSARARKQWETGKQPRGDNKWWEAQNNVARFTPNIDGNRLLIKGKNTIPAERLGDALTMFDEAVNAGEFDRAIEANYSGKATGGRTSTTSKTARTPNANKGWSEERRARYQATMAAKKKG